MIIFLNNTQIDLPVNDNSYRYRAIKGEHSLTLYYSLSEHVEIPLGAYCFFEGETYTLENPENFKKHNTRNFEYTLIMEATQAKLKKYKFKDTNTRLLKFSLTATPKEHLQMLVDNLNQCETDWEVGACIDAVEKVISYNHAFCSEALSQMADEFETEWEIVGKTINLRKVEYNKDNPLPLSYGRGNGFKSGVGRTSGDKKPVEILYVQGGERNIDASKYPTGAAIKSRELLLPNNQETGYDGEYFSHQEEFNPGQARWYVTDADGFSLRRSGKDLESHAEDSLDCSHIYPSLPLPAGFVTGVEEVDAEKHFWDFFDTKIPQSLDFSQYRINGEKITIIFQSGMLTGKEFDLKQTDNGVTGYIHSERRFKLVPQEIDGRTMPDDIFCPQIGDKYAVFGMMLPDSYICDDETKSGASWDMFREAVKYKYENEEQKFTFTGELDGIWAKKDWVNIGGRIKLGGYVLFNDNQFQPEGIPIRIIGIKDYINNPHSPTIELSNEIVGSSIRSNLRKIETNEVVMDDLHRDALQFTKRRFRDSQETIGMLEDALLDRFTNSINPVAVQTMLALIGDESLQFRFVNNTTNPVTVPHNVTYNASTKILTAPGGIMQHMTLGISSISSSHEYKFWELEGVTGTYNSPPLTDGEKKYYLYAKVSKTSTAGVFYLSETAIAMEGIAGYYHLLMGVLNSEYEGERSYVPLYGFTEILPGRITTDRVVSSDGGNYLDFLNNAFRVGNNNTSLEFNTKGDGKLVLKGTMVQSTGGDESPLGCFRGEYNPAYTYYSGDEVTYQGSTYRYIYNTQASGIAPTNATYWQIIASKGSDGANAQTFYTWIKYADSSTGLGLSDSPTGKKYIGFAYNKTTATESNSASDYIWSLITGTDGVPGAPGEDGQTLYTWIKYSDYSDGTNMYDIPTNNTMYIGIAVNKPTATESANKTDYTWSKFKGDQGVPGQNGTNGTDGAYFEYRYAKNGSRTVPPSLGKPSPDPSGWSTTMPVLNPLEYLYMTMAKKSASGGLLQNWSTPVRTTGIGSGAAAPNLNRRGDFSSLFPHYSGSSSGVDAVKYGGIWYITRVDAGTFNNVMPTDNSKWNDFGANFESLATDLLLADNANIAGWIFRNQRLESQDGKVFMDGVNGKFSFGDDNKISFLPEGSRSNGALIFTMDGIEAGRIAFTDSYVIQRFVRDNITTEIRPGTLLLYGSRGIGNQIQMYVDNVPNGTSINIQGLPTSQAGLTGGFLWRDSQGYLRIV